LFYIILAPEVMNVFAVFIRMTKPRFNPDPLGERVLYGLRNGALAMYSDLFVLITLLPIYA
jgi:hypothetical protein